MSNWINYWLFWLYIYIHEQFSLVYLMPVPVFSLFSWFVYCNTCSMSMKKIKPNAMENYYFKEKLYVFLLINLGNVFQTFESNSFNNATSNCMCNSDAKKVFKNSWKWHFLFCQFISLLFPCFSGFSLFKLVS